MRVTSIVPATVSAACACALLAACGTDPHGKRDKLEITGSSLPSPFHVGDTSGLWTASKTVILATGKSDKTADYVSFHLVSSDTGVVGVVQGRFVAGRAAGSAEVYAKDDKSDLTSESPVTVTVVAP
jgi:hypothetical protein